MRRVWKVRVHFQEDIDGVLLEDWYSFNVEAEDDIAARKKGVECAKKDCDNESFLVQYVEIEHLLDLEG